jgi:LuxR family maltose regulon positive regulatory protein
LAFLRAPTDTGQAAVSQEDAENLEKALGELDQLDGFLRKANRKTIRIDLLALQALILDAQGKERAAFEKLSESLALAEPGGFIRNFLDLGPPMATLLQRLLMQNVAVDYIEKLLAVFRDDERVVVPEAADHPSTSPQRPRHPSTSSQSLIDPLTHREIDVLELLAQRLQNKEIADKLFVSTETVKAHLKNIYQKLNVSKRREAVEKAKKMGIL